MTSLPLWTAIAFGGAIGAVSRYAISSAALRLFGPGFPFGTLIVNVSGSFLMGVLIVWLAGREPNPITLRGFLAVGVLGAFTTFSTFAWEAVTLYRDKALGLAGFYIAASLVLSVGGLLAGLFIARHAS